MALRSEVVDLVRMYSLNHADQAAGVRHVAIVQEEVAVPIMWVLVEMIDAVGIEQGAAALDPVDLIALGEQQLGKIGSILSGDAGDQSPFLHSPAFCPACKNISFPEGAEYESGAGDLRNGLDCRAASTCSQSGLRRSPRCLHKWRPAGNRNR